MNKFDTPGSPIPFGSPPKRGSKSMPSVPIISTITTLPQKLKIVSLEKKVIPQCTHCLMKILFFSESSSPFVSYTETNDEVSLILDEESASMLYPKELFKISDQFWRAIQFSLGSSPTDGAGFVSEIAGPLGRAGISIFFLTTFNSDLILVEDSKFASANACLKANFPVVWTESDESEEADDELIEKYKNLGTSTPPNGPLPDSIRRLQAFPDLGLVLTLIPNNKILQAFRDLVELILYPKSSFRFLSFTQLEDEISLLIDTETLRTFPREHLDVVLEDPWVPMKREKKKDLQETGVVSAIAAPLQSLSMLYLSSFMTGWIMVKKNDFQKATTKLTDKGFVITTVNKPESSN